MYLYAIQPIASIPKHPECLTLDKFIIIKLFPQEILIVCQKKIHNLLQQGSKLPGSPFTNMHARWSQHE